MKTLILPGFSLPNKEWAERIAGQLPGAEVVYWKHWEGGQAQLQTEHRRIAEMLGEGGNIIAKSIGTLVGMNLVREFPKAVKKMVLCGVPVNDLSEEDKRAYEVLAGMPAGEVLVIQNESDPHGSYAQIQAFLQKINPNLTIVSKSRSDHEYDYAGDFEAFLVE